ncbi:MAG: hypothetical protein RIM99_12430 [Cyclobacteriaceae bacterium]
MMEKEHLHLLIDEEIYLIQENAGNGSLIESDHAVESSRPEAVGSQSPVKQDATEIKTPDAPSAPEKISVAFIHNSDNPEELELLNKIIGACNLDPSTYKILKQGEEISFSKGVIFTDSSDSYYQSKIQGEATILNSKPLHVLINSKEDKVQLWAALKQLVSK